MNTALMSRASYYLYQDPNLLGEFLRDITFPESVASGKGSYGCYSTFTTEHTFDQVYKNTPLFDSIMYGLHGAPSEDDPTYNAEREANINESYAYHSGYYDITVGWFWDGDGVLYFETNKKRQRILNPDCKNSLKWEWLKNE
jgi:hypothetical protein